MEITLLQIVLVFIVACIAGMESVLDEFQFHRPLVACTLIGAVLGDMKTGIIIGGTLEMIALGWMNIGAAVAPDAALASIISTVLVIAGHQSIGAGIALAIPLAAAGQVRTIIVRTITVAFQHAADKAAENGNLTALSWLHVSSLFLQAMRIAIPAVIVAISVGTSEVQGLLNAIPLFDAGRGMKFLTYAAPALRNAMTDCIRAALGLFEQRMVDKKDGPGFQRVYLDDVLSEDERMLRIEAIADPHTQTPEQIYIQKEQLIELYAALDKLTAREQTYLLYRYGFTDGIEHPLIGAALHFHLSESWTKKVEGEAMDSLRGKLPWWF